MSSQVQQTISPIDGSVYAERELATQRQIDAALDRAVAAQRDWRNTPLDARAAICRAMAAWCREHVIDLATELTWQIGRPITYTPFEILRGFQERVEYMAGIAGEALA